MYRFRRLYWMADDPGGGGAGDAPPVDAPPVDAPPADPAPTDPVTDDPAELAKLAGVVEEPKPYDLDADPKGLKGLDLSDAKLLGKYANVPEVLAALQAAEASLAPPEKYQIEGDEWGAMGEEAQASLQEYFKKAGIPAHAAQEVWNGASALMKVANEAVGIVSLSEKWGLNAAQTKQRCQETLAWAVQTMPDDEVKHLAKMGAAGYDFMHAKRTSNWEKPAFRGDQTPASSEDAALRSMFPTMFAEK